MLGNDKKLILVTGASGFLGTYVAEACLAAGHSLLGVDIHPPRFRGYFDDFCVDSCGSVSWDRFLGKRSVDVVFHLAGGASVPDSVENPYQDFATSVPGTVRLVNHIARYHSSTHLVFFSSAAVYGNPNRLPIDEDATVSPISPYGIHKASSEFLLRHYTRLHNLRASILRIFSAYGPGLRKQFFWDLSKRAFEAVARGQKSLTVYGTGQESRDFMYSTDIANAALWIANRSALPGCEVFNVASGREATIADAASLLIEQLDIDVSLRFSGVTRTGEPLNWRADVTKLASTGFRPEVSFSEGASRVARWMKEELSVEAYRAHSASAV